METLDSMNAELWLKKIQNAPTTTLEEISPTLSDVSATKPNLAALDALELLILEVTCSMKPRLLLTQLVPLEFSLLIMLLAAQPLAELETAPLLVETEHKLDSAALLESQLGELATSTLLLAECKEFRPVIIP